MIARSDPLASVPVGALRLCRSWFACRGSLAICEPGTRPATDSKLPPARQEYFGRQIAQTMHYTGAEWLIRDVREREERCSLMLANLGVRLGQTILDMGCGNGFYSLPLAKMVGPTGRILAVDIQPEMLVMLRTRAEQEGDREHFADSGLHAQPARARRQRRSDPAGRRLSRVLASRADAGRHAASTQTARPAGARGVPRRGSPRFRSSLCTR